MYMYTNGIVAEQKSYGFNNFVKLETVPMKFKIPVCTMLFDFFVQNLIFWVAECYFGYLIVIF